MGPAAGFEVAGDAQFLLLSLRQVTQRMSFPTRPRQRQAVGKEARSLRARLSISFDDLLALKAQYASARV